MTEIDIRLSEQEVAPLRTWKHQQLLSIQHEKFLYTAASEQAVGFNVAGSFFYLYNFTEPMDYFGTTEDVARLTLETVRYPCVDKKDWMTFPIEETIESIQLVQEQQELYEAGEKIYDVHMTRGLILDLGDRELAFEKHIWFTEEILIHQGHSLITAFRDPKEFEEDWVEGCQAKCTRSVLTL